MDTFLNKIGHNYGAMVVVEGGGGCGSFCNEVVTCQMGMVRVSATSTNMTDNLNVLCIKFTSCIFIGRNIIVSQ